MEESRLPSIHDTAYPRLKSSFSEKELNAIFTPTAEELALAHGITQSTALRIGFLVLLKTFQRLGYFNKVPRQVAEHLSMLYGVHYEAMEWEAYDTSGSRYRHIALHPGACPFSMSGSIIHAARPRRRICSDVAS
jgi:Domain of unknown function (DUF4158)